MMPSETSIHITQPSKGTVYTLCADYELKIGPAFISAVQVCDKRRRPG